MLMKFLDVHRLFDWKYLRDMTLLGIIDVDMSSIVNEINAC
jgi:hypothetical protein